MQDAHTFHMPDSRVFFPPGGYIYSTKVSMYFFTEFLQTGVVHLIEAFPGNW